MSTPSSCSSDLVAVGRSMGEVYPGQSAVMTSDHQPPPSMEDQLCRGQGGYASTWTVGIQWARWLWCFPGHAGQGQAPSVFCLGHSVGAIKQSEMHVTCAWSGDSQAKPSYESRLAALLPGLGALSKR